MRTELVHVVKGGEDEGEDEQPRQRMPENGLGAQNTALRFACCATALPCGLAKKGWLEGWCRWAALKSDPRPLLSYT